MNLVREEREYLECEEVLKQQLHKTTIVGSVKFLLLLTSAFATFYMSYYVLSQLNELIAKLFGV